MDVTHGYTFSFTLYREFIGLVHFCTGKWAMDSSVDFKIRAIMVAHEQ